MTERNNSNRPIESSERLETEALAWIAQMSGDNVTAKDIATFREWIQRSPAHEAEIKSIAKLWGEMNTLSYLQEDIHIADKLSKKLRRKDSKLRKVSKWVIGGAAASFIAFSGSYTLLVKNDSTPEIVAVAEVNVPIVFQSMIGEQQEHLLEDGSIITLNTDSHIEVNFTDKQRNIRLLKGEAMFSVEHDPLRPFLVFAAGGIVRAVGTEFSVRIEENKIIDVVVSEGTVELSTISPTLPDKTGEIIKMADLSKVSSLGVITAGQSAKIVEHEAVVELKSMAEIETKHAWRNGELVFTGQQLDEVISEVGRYTDLNIIIADAELNAIRFGGLFKVGDTDVLFRTLNSQFGIEANFSDDNKNVVLTKK